MDIKNLLKIANNLSASDLHICPGYPPVFRIDGQLKKADAKPVGDREVEKAIKSLLEDSLYEKFQENKEIDFAYSDKEIGRFRVNLFKQMNGISIAFRIITNKIKTLEELPAPPSVYELARKKNGLIIVTGPTGSGKSTTLAAIINLINKERREHIITIEDPIEFVHEGINCLINQREIGQDSHSFANALRSALREDPDVIMLGEMRDLETISLAITAAETGHLVFGSLHVADATQTFTRILEFFPRSDHEFVRSSLASSLRAIFCQRLLPGIEEGSRYPAT